MLLNWRTLAYGLVLASIDSVGLPILKGVSRGWNWAWMAVPISLYICTPLVFLASLSTESLVVMNLVWDLMSDILVTCVGLFLFSEKLSPVKLLGVGFSFLAITLMAAEEKGMDQWLEEAFRVVKTTLFNTS